ncbi:uncharacterized protein LOC122251510 isoform X2 [Penaeus japonicus]|nr:uncharacterized protein LOC122251510 isoform X2 [Penaeus japonicus]
MSFATWHWAKHSVIMQNEAMHSLMEKEANVKCRKILREALQNRTEEVIKVAQKTLERILAEKCPVRQRREIEPFTLFNETLPFLSVLGEGDM